MFIKRTVLVVFFGLLLWTAPHIASAAVCQSNVATGDWNTAGSWTNCGGLVPQTADTVQILSGHTITLNTSPTVASVVIESGGALTEDGSGRTLSITNSWTNSGTFTAGSGSVVFLNNIGSVTLAGDTTFNNLTFSSGSSGNKTYVIGSAATTTTFTVNGTLGIASSRGVILNTGNTDTGVSNLDVLGDISLTNTGNGGGNALLTIKGTGNQTLTGTVVPGDSALPKVVINRDNEDGGAKLTLNNHVSIANDWTYLSGTVDATTNDSTLVIHGAAVVTSAGMTFDNVFVRSATMTLGSDIDIDGNIIINNNRTLTTSASNYNMTVAGDWTNSHIFTSGTGTVTFDGSGNSTVITGGTGTSQDFNNFTVNKSGSGVVQLSTNGLDVDGTLTVTAGTLDLNGQSLTTATTCNISGTLKLTGDESLSCTPTLNSGSTVVYSATSGTRDIKNWTYHHLTINGSGGTFTGAADETLGGNLTVTAGTLDISTGSRTFNVGADLVVNGGTLTSTNSVLDIAEDVTISSGTFTAPTATTTVAGNWNKSGGTFTHSSGTIHFDGSDQDIDGSTTFYNLVKTDTANDSTDLVLTFDNAGTQTIEGVLRLKGIDTDDRINLVSDSPGTHWSLVANGTFDIDWVEVTDSDASGGSAIQYANTEDGGNNLNWFVVNSAPTVSNLGPASLVDGSWTTDNTPTLTFTTADDDDDLVRYHIQIDDSSDFGSVVDESYSSFAAAGIGSYTPAALADAAYYWRVRVFDGTATSSYATANSGNVAFRVDTAAPELSAISAGTPGATSATITWTTDENSTSQVEYGLTDSYGTVTSLDTDLVTSHSVMLSGLTSATTYHYRVASVDAAGQVSSSTDQTFVTADGIAPSVALTAPTDGAVVRGDLSLAASASDNVGVAAVQFKQASGTLIGSEDNSEPYGIAWDTTAVADGDYSLVAVARDNAGNYATSTAVNVEIDNTAPTAGTITLISVSATAVTASSTASGDAESGLAASPYLYHNVTRGTYSGLISGTWTESGLTPNTSYTFQVGVFDRAGNVATSTTAATTTLASLPASLVLTIDSANQITASWSANGNPAGTEYYVENVTAGTNSGWITDTSWVSDGLATSTSYTFEIKARNSEEVETAAVADSAMTDDGEDDGEEDSEGGGSGGRRGGGSRRRVLANPVVDLSQLGGLLERAFGSLLGGTDIQDDQLVVAPNGQGNPIPPISASELPAETPPSFRGDWALLPEISADSLVLQGLPPGVSLLAQKFPSFGRTLLETGISKFSDLQRLEYSKLRLPGLTTAIRNRLPDSDLPAGGIPLSQLSADLKAQLPTDVVFVRSGALADAAGDQRGIIDFPIALGFTDDGNVRQQVSSLVGQPLRLVVRPEHAAKKITGYLVLNEEGPIAGKIETVPVGALVASPIFSQPRLSRVIAQEKEVEQRFVVSEFAYTDPDADGLYSADIVTPLVAGTYEVITVVDYVSVDLGSKELRLTAVIDPEGYIYDLVDGKELRIPEAVVSLYWLNPGTGQYELWPADNYSQVNPQTTDQRGSYSFLVPEGMYYLTAVAPGYHAYQGEPFTVQAGAGVHKNIKLEGRFGWRSLMDWRTIALGLLLLALAGSYYRRRRE